MTTVSRLVIATDFNPTCCDGAPFLPDDVMEQAPKEMKDLVSDSEWFAAMSRLQSVTLKESVSLCTQLSLPLCFGILGALCCLHCTQRKQSKLDKRIRLAIQEVNAQLFAPKGLYAALKVTEFCKTCRSKSYVLVVALTAEEAKILLSENGIIH